MPGLYAEDVVDVGLPACTSPRRCTGRELLLMYCRLLMPAISAAGDMDMVRWPGDGVDMGDPWLDP
jgi:hypothetical protein